MFKVKVAQRGTIRTNAARDEQTAEHRISLRSHVFVKIVFFSLNCVYCTGNSKLRNDTLQRFCCAAAEGECRPIP